MSVTDSVVKLARAALSDDWHPNMRDVARTLARAVLEMHAADPHDDIASLCLTIDSLQPSGQCEETRQMRLKYGIEEP